MARANDELENFFPGLGVSKDYSVTSPCTGEYNCIAWAAEVNDEWWWPEHDGYWPAGLPRENTLANFIEAFKQLGYAPCNNFKLEPETQKVAIYVSDDGAPTHMARQLEDGVWTSKCGPAYDISHVTLQGLEGALYGKAALPLKRAKSSK